MEIDTNLYNELLTIDWLSQCGNSIDGLYEFEVYQIKDVNKAIKEVAKTKWSNISLEAQNELTAFLFLNHKDEYNKNWNVQVKKIRDELNPRLVEILHSKNIQIEFINDIKWNMISILMLSYYSKYGFQSKFFEHILAIYKSGHIPCGWQGKYPNGKVMVY